jgi:betaine-aldehyde dehydrogenase
MTSLAPDPVDALVRGREFPLLVGGEHVDGEGDELEVVDPSTGVAVAVVRSASRAQVDAAVAAALRAQPAWHGSGVRARVDAVERFASLLADRAEEIALLDSIDSGNPLPSMRRDMRIASEYLRRWPGWALSLAGRTAHDDPEGLHFTTYHPYGVVGRIAAFNHPALFTIGGTLLALLAGNAVVVKSSELTPLSSLVLGELYAKAFPPGVVNVVAGGAGTGDALVVHPRVKRLAFTGSVPTGLAIQRRAAESGVVKHVSLELGGKNAMVVFPDVDLDEVVEAAMLGMSLEISQGQSCQATSRILVHRSIASEFVARAAARLARYRHGRAYDEDTQMGPLVSARQLERVSDYVELGEREGATRVLGGGRPPGVPDGGFYLEPVLFADVRPEMRIAREEIFGPVLAVLEWERYDELLELANGVEFGLTGSVWSRDVDLALQTAAKLEAGYVWVNDTNRHYLGAPFGGMKQSGVGREESPEELLGYLETKVTHVKLRDPQVALDRLG